MSGAENGSDPGLGEVLSPIASQLGVARTVLAGHRDGNGGHDLAGAQAGTAWAFEPIRDRDLTVLVRAGHPQHCIVHQ